MTGPPVPVRPAAGGRAEQRLDAAVAALLDLVEHGVLVLDERYRVVAANPAFVALTGLGVPPDRLTGTALPAGPATYSHLYADPSATRERHEAMLAAGRRVRGELQVLADGSSVAHDYTPVTTAGVTTGHVWVLREPGTGQGDGEAAGDPADDGGSGWRAEFTATLAHEVRTPATSITAFAEMLDDTGLEPASRHRAAEAVRRNAERMLTLAADLLLVSELQAGPASPDRDPPTAPAGPTRSAPSITSAELVASAVAATDPDIVPVIEGDCRLAGDPVLLRRAVSGAVGVVAALAGPPATEVSALATATGATVTCAGPADRPVTLELLLAARVHEPDNPEAYRTAAWELLLSRAVVERHGGTLATRYADGRYTVTLCLPAS